MSFYRDFLFLCHHSYVMGLSLLFHESVPHFSAILPSPPPPAVQNLLQVKQCLKLYRMNPSLTALHFHSSLEGKRWKHLGGITVAAVSMWNSLHLQIQEGLGRWIKFLDKIIFTASSHSVECFEGILNCSVDYWKTLETA